MVINNGIEVSLLITEPVKNLRASGAATVRGTLVGGGDIEYPGLTASVGATLVASSSTSMTAAASVEVGGRSAPSPLAAASGSWMSSGGKGSPVAFWG